MAEKFCTCIATTARSPEARAEVLHSLYASGKVLLDEPVWMCRIEKDAVHGEPWNDGPIEIQEGAVTCLYPRERSAVAGAWVFERIMDCEIWTAAIPAIWLESRTSEVLDMLWRLSDISLPCIAGNEYSLSAVLRYGNPEAEARTPRSLATHAVVDHLQAPPGWLRIREAEGRVLVARPSVAQLLGER